MPMSFLANSRQCLALSFGVGAPWEGKIQKEANFKICCGDFYRRRVFRQMGAELFHFSWAEPGKSEASGPVSHFEGE